MGSEAMLERLGKLEGRVEEHSRMIEDIGGRFNHLEARIEHLDAKVDRLLGDLEGRIGHLNAKVDRLFEIQDSKMTRYFTWTIGITMTAWLTVLFKR